MAPYFILFTAIIWLCAAGIFCAAGILCDHTQPQPRRLGKTLAYVGYAVLALGLAYLFYETFSHLHFHVEVKP